MTYSDIISSIGVSFILLAFFLTTFGYLRNNGVSYFVLNLIGGLFALYGSILLGSLPFAILEATWTIVALIGLLKNTVWIKKQS